MPPQQLSPHFSLAELTYSEIAARRGIPNDLPVELLPNLTRVANVLERPLLARHRRNGLEIYLHPLSLSRLLPLNIASLELARLHKSATRDEALLSTGSFPIDVVDIRLPCKLDHRTIRSG